VKEETWIINFDDLQKLLVEIIAPLSALCVNFNFL
jgi:hypothetical protein